MEITLENIPPHILSLIEARSDEPLLIYRKKAERILGVGTTRFYELMKMPSFPKPKLMDGKRPMYLRKDIENWAINS